MADDSETPFPGDSSGPRHHRHSSSGRSHSRSSHHSDRSHRSPRKHPVEASKYRLEDEHKLERQRKIESFFTRNILSIFAMIFLGGAIWFGVITWKSRSTSIREQGSTELFYHRVINLVDSFKETVLNPAIIKQDNTFPDSLTVIFIVITLVFILSSLLFSFRTHNIFLKILSFLGWIVLFTWLLIKVLSTSSSLYFYTSLVISFVVYILFFISGFADTYIGRSKWKYYTEYWLILLNSLFFAVLVIYLLQKFSFNRFESLVIFFLTVLHLIAIYEAERRNIHYNKIPYLISAVVFTCAVLPLLFRINMPILFLAPLSVFLILFSKYSLRQVSVVFSLVSIIIMLIIYIYQWVTVYYPFFFISRSVFESSIYIQGFSAGLFIFSAFLINNNLIHHYTTSLNSKLISKSRLRKWVKGAFLLVSYLFFYWIFSYHVLLVIHTMWMNYFAWFIFTALFFTLIIPLLLRQRSSFLRLTLILGIVTLLLYPVVIYLKTVELRNLYIAHNNEYLFAFLSHYAVILVMLLLIFVLLKEFKKGFAGKKVLIKSFWVFLYFISLFVLITEYDHIYLIFTPTAVNGNLDTDLRFMKLSYSLLMIISSLALLILGFINKSRFLRIVSLIILALILIKILIFDISRMSNEARTILFFVLGFFLLGISIFYRKVKLYFFQKDSGGNHVRVSRRRKKHYHKY